LISSALQLFPGMPCTVVFQPHLFSRTRDHARAFGQVLSMADEAILFPIYPARELPVEGVSSALIAEHMDVGKGRLMEKEAWIQWLHGFEGGLLITAGAGDIDTLLPEAVRIIKGKGQTFEA
jgi:UDP-N-acetylmuramate--alanine ligase